MTHQETAELELFNETWNLIRNKGHIIQTGTRDIYEIVGHYACLDDDGSTKLIISSELRVIKDYFNRLTWYGGDFETLCRISSVLKLCC